MRTTLPAASALSIFTLGLFWLLFGLRLCLLGRLAGLGFLVGGLGSRLARFGPLLFLALALDFFIRMRKAGCGRPGRSGSR